MLHAMRRDESYSAESFFQTELSVFRGFQVSQICKPPLSLSYLRSCNHNL